MTAGRDLAAAGARRTPPSPARSPDGSAERRPAPPLHRNHTWHADIAGRALFLEASPDPAEARAEHAGHARIHAHDPVPRLHAALRIGPWTLTAYERWLPAGTGGLLLDEITCADHHGGAARLDACLDAVFGWYRTAISQTLLLAPSRETVTKLYGDRAAPSGRLDAYYQADRPWSLSAPADLGRRHPGRPTDLNIGWSVATGPVWFDYDTAGLNALAGEFACFLLYQRLHGAWLTPKYNPADFRDHPAALAAPSIPPPAASTSATQRAGCAPTWPCDCWPSTT